MLSKILSRNATQLRYYGAQSSRNVCPNRLKDKIAIITGSTDGIGLAIAERFCKEGAKVVISSRKYQNVEKTVEDFNAKGYTVIGIPCDIDDQDQRVNLVEKTVKDLGGIDIFVSNAGINVVYGSILKANTKMFNKTLSANLKAPFMLTQLIAPHMLERNNPCSILYVSSYAAYVPNTYVPAYSISKTGLLSLSQAMAQDFAQSNVRVNSIAPGLINTKMTFRDPSDPTGEKEILPEGAPKSVIQSLLNESKKFTENIPMGRRGNVGEVAGAAAFLCSEDASYVHGENLAISGGVYSKI